MRRILLFGACLLAACGPEMSAEEKAAADAQAIAAVEANQQPPVMPVAPEKILYPDIEQHELYGTSCAFAPEGGGLGAIALAMEDAGYLKLDGEVLRLAADKGSGELPMLAREKYDGKAYSFRLELDQSAGTQEGIETINYPARLTILDAADRVAFSASGIAQCGS